MPTLAIYARKSSESEDRQILSIDSQVRELKQFAARDHLPVAQVFTESKSAKSPGRPVFNELFSLVQQGKVDAILCWKLDRLARNPVDGGAVIWAMEERKLVAIHTPQRSFQNSGNDKFWMQLEFGMAKKYVDDLSDNVKRGIRAKLEQGWLSGLPPLGYLNERSNRTIVKDPERFFLVRRMWDLILSGKHTPPQILRIATGNWGLRTRQFKRIGGAPVARSGIYKLFKNPFYYGAIVRRGEYFQGRHPAMVTKSEFDRVQRLLGVATNPRPQRCTFAFTGLIRCGECGASVTAEHKRNRYGRKYVYYHCTKRKPGISCTQRVIEVTELERQIETFLATVTISAKARDWAVKRVSALNGEEAEKVKAGLDALNKQYSTSKRQLAELVDMRLRGLLTDDEYLTKKRDLHDECMHLQELLEKSSGTSANTVDRCIEVFDFAQSAMAAFAGGSVDDKRTILSFVGSNFFLKDKILAIQPQEPLVYIQRTLKSAPTNQVTLEPLNFSKHQRKYTGSSTAQTKWCALVDDVRTFFLQHPSHPSFKKLVAELSPADFPTPPAGGRSPGEPSGRTRAGGSTAPAPTGRGSSGSSQSERRAYGA